MKKTGRIFLTERKEMNAIVTGAYPSNSRSNQGNSLNSEIRLIENIIHNGY